MPEKLKPPDEDKRRLTLYGPPKSWKTTSLASIPKGEKIYIVDLDRQLGSFKREWERRKHPVKNRKIVTIDSSGDRDTWDIVQDIKAAMWSPPKGFDWYAVDCMTTMGLLMTHEFIGKGEDRDYNRQSNTELLSCVTDYFWQFVATAETEGAWTVLIFHEKWMDYEDGMTDPNAKDAWKNKKSILVPEIASSARTIIPGQCPFVWHVEKGREVRGGKNVPCSFVRTIGAPFIMASSTGYDGILNTMEPLDFDRLMGKMGLKKRKGASKGRKR